MSQPWGMSGPQFTQLYLVLLAVPVLVGAIWRQAQIMSTKPDGRPRPSVTVHHLAYLVAGPRRVAESAVAALIDAQYLRTDSQGVLHRCATTEPADPMERAVSRVADGNRVRDIPPLVTATVELLAADLAARGLVVPVRAVALRRRTVAALYAVVGVLGAARLVNGVQLDRPVGYVELMLVVDLVAVLVAVRVAARGRPNLTTPAGQRLVRAAGAQRVTDSVVGHAGMVLGGAAAGVALYGLLTYPDEEIVSALAYVPPSSGGWSSSGSSSGCGSSCSSGSSCGGGGCGGGGCGG